MIIGIPTYLVLWLWLCNYTEMQEMHRVPTKTFTEYMICCVFRSILKKKAAK